MRDCEDDNEAVDREDAQNRNRDNVHPVTIYTQEIAIVTEAPLSLSKAQ
jgi:hypothetical protein